MEKICHHCNNVLPENANMKFCPFCGKTLAIPPRPPVNNSIDAPARPQQIDPPARPLPPPPNHAHSAPVSVREPVQRAQPLPPPPKFVPPHPAQAEIIIHDEEFTSEVSSKKAKKHDVSEEGSSKYTGGAFGLFGVNLGVLFGSLITLFLAYPWLYCWKKRYLASHTYINGRQEVFDGTGGQLIGSFIKWLLLILITFGIYSFWMVLNMQRWQTKHTHFKDNDGQGVSEFDGRLIQLIGIMLASGFLLLITLFIGYFWIKCWLERWYAKHTIIDGERLAFDGKGLQYFGLLIKQFLLTIITFGIYIFWLVVSSIKWITKHTRIRYADEPVEVEHKPGYKAAVAFTICQFIFFIVPVVNLIFSILAAIKARKCESKPMRITAIIMCVLSVFESIALIYGFITPISYHVYM